MKILLTSPFCWPYVRRGNERFIAELSRYLAERGYDVTVLSTKPGPSEIKREGGATVVRMSEIRHVALSALGLTPETTFAWICRCFLRDHRFDVIHCLYVADGFAAAWSSAKHQTPYIMHFTGIPTRRVPRRRPLDYVIQKLALSRASKVVLISQAAARELGTVKQVAPEIIPVPCDLKTFTLNPAPRDLDRPLILGVGAFSEPRKGANILVRAFEQLKQDLPRAVLALSGQMPGALREQLLSSLAPAVRNDVQFLGVGLLRDLPALYGQATVTVVPSTGEAYGMSLVESLACGTPVVGGRDGGPAEIVGTGVGALFDPHCNRGKPTNVHGLAGAIREVLRLYRNPALATQCRQSVTHLGWDTLGPRFEHLYATALQPHRSVA